ncbi:MAG: sn-glycerol-3-phosphate ABC transporter ATP-binding protein UgpC [Burkholderiales bacterium]|nr:sn-glycerol-3-phosphate ABC transporter ATP-binding protein UgpC [Burkholderiales bacterium]
MADLVLRGVTKAFGAATVLDGVDLAVADGELVVLVGPSGCGKSTLLRLVAGLDELTRGEILIGGRRVEALPPQERGVAMMFQSYALYPHMSVRDSMAFGLSVARYDRAAIRARVEQAARLLQIAPLLGRKPGELSGGQRQRVALGRAIVRDPAVFLLDEPLSNLDAALRARTRLELARLHRTLNATTLYVTHDQLEAMTLAERLVVLREGRIEQVGAPLEVYRRPRNAFVAGFLGSPTMNFIGARVAVAGPCEVACLLPDGVRLRAGANGAALRAGDPVTLGIRPEHLRLADDADARIRGPVAVVERSGDACYAYLEVAGARDGLLVARLDPDSRIRPGDRLSLAAPLGAVHVFDADGVACPPAEAA